MTNCCHVCFSVVNIPVFDAIIIPLVYLTSRVDKFDLLLHASIHKVCGSSDVSGFGPTMKDFTFASF